jgi:hypothetical protein
MSKQYHTYDDLKRAARRHSREHGVLYTRALELISVEAGFCNHLHASAEYAKRIVLRQFPVTVFQFWRDRNEREVGTESLQLSLSRPLEELVRPHHCQGYLGGVRIEDGNQLIGYDAAQAERHAHQELCRYARVLQFMDATGLKPSRSHRGYPKSRWENRKPNSDHDHHWFDPVKRGYVVTDEPYPGRTSLDDQEVAEWKLEHSYDVVQSRWQSVYGLGTELYFVGKSAGPVDVNELARRLESSPAPISEKTAKFESSGRRRLHPLA